MRITLSHNPFIKGNSTMGFPFLFERFDNETKKTTFRDYLKATLKILIIFIFYAAAGWIELL
jgi:hypothetical protein